MFTIRDAILHQAFQPHGNRENKATTRAQNFVDTYQLVQSQEEWRELTRSYLSTDPPTQSQQQEVKNLILNCSFILSDFAILY